MEQPIARGFLRLCANSVQWAKTIQAYELRQKPGRYLVPYEIMRMLHLETMGEIKPNRLTAMGELWDQFQARLWKEKQIEEKNHERVCGDAVGDWCHCRTPQQEMHAWDDFVAERFREPVVPKDYHEEYAA